MSQYKAGDTVRSRYTPRTAEVIRLREINGVPGADVLFKFSAFTTWYPLEHITPDVAEQVTSDAG